ncbi:MAG: hypothetical protein CMO80_12605 [Verrucomicrobiales bacterium]|nr:hypothetical protein [Verrucomicrobiales bacterium]|tara:strand:+ start:7039 stop:8550 length:1512 start_codon:yes stop_codon:yes gene_type:complete
MKLKHLTFLAVAVAFTLNAYAATKPPKGFRALFNGKDLSGWTGLNPHRIAKLSGEKREANLAQQKEEFAKHWTVENGELVNDGHGPYANTVGEFGDMEFMLEYKTVAKADSGIYLRYTPQVQIWDSGQAFDPERPTRKPHLGSGGLFNNAPGSPGRDPMQHADASFGEWNQFFIRQIGGHTWVWLNGKLVADGVMHNYWDRSKPLRAKGPIMLQTHGGEIRWRNIFVREIGKAEGKKLLAEARVARQSLAGSLSLHASFDKGLDADYSRGDRSSYVRGKQLTRAVPTADVVVDPKGGKFGGALHFTKKNRFRPAYKHPGILNYNDKSWNATVSVWLRLTPDEDLEPGYCDPIQIVGDSSKNGFIFLEWSKDHSPRYFRYAIRPRMDIWNPDNLGWEQVKKRPMVQLSRAPFSRDKWTHVAFTLENVNGKKPKGSLYMNGRPQGTIENWDLSFEWNPAQVFLVLGASYVGHLDELAVFDRVLTAEEVGTVYRLKDGVRDLYTGH